MRSLRARLWALWLLVSLALLAVALLLLSLVRTTVATDAEREAAVTAHRCDAIRDRYAFYTAGWDGAGAAPGRAFGRDLGAVLAAALTGTRDLHAGIWSDAAGPLAEARSPAGTAAGPSARAIAPGTIAALVGEAERADDSVQRRLLSDDRLVLLAACPLAGPAPGLIAWVWTAAPRPEGSDTLRLGLASLLALVLLIAFLVVRLTTVWGRHVAALETALSAHDVEALPRLAATGEKELDRIVLALNEAGARLAAARARAEALAAGIAVDERLAAFGRLAAGVAHEIRNPMAAMRLRCENALAGDAARARPALEANLVQIARIDALIDELLAMTQRRVPAPERLSPAAFLRGCAADWRARADAAGITLDATPEAGDPAGPAWFDPALVRRILDSLLQNAIRHTPEGGRVAIAASGDSTGLAFRVTDTGPGVAPALRERLFEPFVSGRPEGTGLGLAIARELARAQGGTLELAEPGAAGCGSAFLLRLPVTEPCRPS